MPKCDLNNFIEITLRHGSYPVNLLHISRAPFPRNTSGWLLLQFVLHKPIELTATQTEFRTTTSTRYHLQISLLTLSELMNL